MLPCLAVFYEQPGVEARAPCLGQDGDLGLSQLLGGERLINIQQHLHQIRDSDGDERAQLVEGLHVLALPMIRRAVVRLRGSAKVKGLVGDDDITLIVTEAFFSLIYEVANDRLDPAVGSEFERAITHRAQAEFRRYLRATPHGPERIATVTAGVSAMAAGIHLDRPHLIRIHHELSLDTRFVGPFDSAMAALEQAEEIECELRVRDERWQATVHPLLPLGTPPARNR